MQNMSLRRLFGPFKTPPVDVLQTEAGILPYQHGLEYMVAKKAV